MNKSYNTKEGILAKIGSLEQLNALILERHTAGYKRSERMQEFYLLGRFYLDTCGNTSRLVDELIPKDQFPDIPDVLTKEEMFAYIKERTDSDRTRLVSSSGSHIPPSEKLCPECNEGWTVENCHDTVVSSNTRVFPLTKFVGKSLREAKSAFSRRTDATYQLLNYTDQPIRRTSGIEKWYGDKDGINDEYIIQAGDEGHFYAWTYSHAACHKARLAIKQKTEFQNVFSQAGFTQTSLEAIPNGYCRCERCAPWYRVNIDEDKVVTIGWRKRVINIDWSETGFHGDVTGGDEVTKGDTYAHAWGTTKAVEYLTTLREKLLLA